MSTNFNTVARNLTLPSKDLIAACLFDINKAKDDYPYADYRETIRLIAEAMYQTGQKIIDAATKSDDEKYVVCIYPHNLSCKLNHCYRLLNEVHDKYIIFCQNRAIMVPKEHFCSLLQFKYSSVTNRIIFDHRASGFKKGQQVICFRDTAVGFTYGKKYVITNDSKLSVLNDQNQESFSSKNTFLPLDELTKIEKYVFYNQSIDTGPLKVGHCYLAINETDEDYVFKGPGDEILTAPTGWFWSLNEVASKIIDNQPISWAKLGKEAICIDADGVSLTFGKKYEIWGSDGHDRRLAEAPSSLVYVKNDDKILCSYGRNRFLSYDDLTAPISKEPPSTDLNFQYHIGVQISEPKFNFTTVTTGD